MGQKKILVTQEGLGKFKTELEHLVSVKREEIAAKIKRAREMGGPENNAEYEDAKNEQAFVEGRILEMEAKLRNSVIIGNEGNSSGLVRLGSKVTIKDPEGEQVTYSIVGSSEAKPALGKISNESPVGRSLLGRKVGEEVPVRTPGGTVNYTVLAID